MSRNKQIIAEYSFITSNDPEKVFNNLCEEQTTSGFHTLNGDQNGLSKYKAKIHTVEVKSSKDGNINGFVKIIFPMENIGISGNFIEDTLCFLIGESHHVHNIKALKLLNIEFDEEILSIFDGPRFGKDGLRKLLNISTRPIFASPLRPEIGFSPEEYAKASYEAFIGGVDIIKDDELLVNPQICPIKIRAKLCSEAKLRAEDKTGEKKIYVLNIGNDITQIEERISIGHDSGVGGFLIHPRLTPSIITYVKERTELPLLAHYESTPTFTQYNNTGIKFSLLLKIFRLSGADIMLLPRPNVRFDIDRSEYVDSLNTCFEQLGSCKTVFPMPTGKNSVNTINECYKILKSKEFILTSGSSVFDNKLGILKSAQKIRKALEAL